MIYEECGDGAGRVARDEFHKHVEPPKQVEILGLEAGAGILVQRQSEAAAAVDDLAAAVAPIDFDVSVEVCS